MNRARRRVLCGLGSLLILGDRVLHAAEPQQAKTKANPPEKDEWKPVGKPLELFDGKTLTGWKIADYAGHGDVTVKDGTIHCDTGEHLSGITSSRGKELPKMSYEISLEAMRVDGGDFFCGLTFEVGKDPCSFIVGGWGGTVTGLSSLNGQDASENETTDGRFFDNERWYRIRTRVLPNRIQCWIDNDRVVNVDTTDKEIGVRIEVEPSRPLGLAAWQTAAAWRKIVVTRIEKA